MSALDDAIHAHMAHPAASGFDPLTDSLAEQAVPYSPRAAPETAPLAAVPLPWLLPTLLIVLALLLCACGGGEPDPEPADDGIKTTPTPICQHHPESCT